MTNDDRGASTRVRLSRHSRQGFLLGLTPWNIATLLLAFVVAWLPLIRLGPLGLVLSSPAWVTLTVVGFANVRGAPLPRLLSLRLIRRVRRVVGGTRSRFRPERPPRQGTIQLPGWRTNVHLLEREGAALAWDPAHRTLSFTAEVAGMGLELLEPRERAEQLATYGRLLAGFASRHAIARVAFQERTAPSHAQHEETSVNADPHADIVDPVANYAAAEAGAQLHDAAHRNYLTVTIRPDQLKDQVARLGGGLTGATHAAMLEIQEVNDALRASGIDVLRWLSVRQVAALSRSALDPAFSRSVADGVDLAAIGPMALEEPAGRRDLVITDSGWHTTLWVHEWPRTEAEAGFLAPVVFARDVVTGRPVRHIFTLVLTPVSTRKALKRIRDDKRTAAQSRRLRSRRGDAESAAERADWADLEQQEADVIAGDAEYRFGAYITVSAESEEELSSAVAGMRNALVSAALESQVLYDQQAEALMVNAFPLGMGMR